MKYVKRNLCLGIVAASAMNAATAEVVDIRWDAMGRFEHLQPIAPGKFAEVCGKLNKGQSIGWTFKASQPTGFNIHYHEGKKVEFPAKLEGAQAAEGVLKVTSDQDYCWMWSNKSADNVDLTFSVQKQP